jgi:hypothetical protein
MFPHTVVLLHLLVTFFMVEINISRGKSLLNEGCFPSNFFIYTMRLAGTVSEELFLGNHIISFYYKLNS